jgi:hypothetical protein
MATTTIRFADGAEITVDASVKKIAHRLTDTKDTDGSLVQARRGDELVFINPRYVALITGSPSEDDQEPDVADPDPVAQ